MTAMGMIRDGPLGYPVGYDTQLEGFRTYQNRQPRSSVTREPDFRYRHIARLPLDQISCSINA